MQTDTHTYDGQLKNRLAEIKSFLDEASKMSKEEKLDRFYKLKSFLKCNPQADTFLSGIIRDYETGNHGANHDPTNNIHAEDLLVLCFNLCFRSAKSPEIAEEVSSLLSLQLEDMATGYCPQGRTTRLVQVVLSFSEFL